MSLPFPSLSFVLLLHSPWLLLNSAHSIIIFSHPKQGGANKLFVCDLCFSSTLGTWGVSSGRLWIYDRIGIGGQKLVIMVLVDGVKVVAPPELLHHGLLWHKRRKIPIWNIFRFNLFFSALWKKKFLKFFFEFSFKSRELRFSPG